MEDILSFLPADLPLTYATTLLQVFKGFYINNKYFSCSSILNMAEKNRSILVSDRAVFPAPKFIPENHYSNNTQNKIKELSISGTFDVGASKNNFMKN